MAPIAKRPRPLDEHDAAANAGYYDNVPGTSLTRASAGPSSVPMSAPGHAAYLSATHAVAPNGGPNGALGGVTSPLLASHLSVRSLAAGSANTHSHHLSSGAEDNEEMAPPPKSTSTRGTRGRGRARGRGRGRGRGHGRGGGTATGSATAVDTAADVSQPYSVQGLPLPNCRLLSETNGYMAVETADNDDKDDPDTPSNPLIFQCRTCFRLLGDSFSFVATDTELGYVILSDVSEVVLQDTFYETSTEPGKDIGSTFARLRCAGCNTAIGRNYRTTPRDLDDLRDCFSLEVDAVHTYMLGSNYTKQLDDDNLGQSRRSGERAAMVVGGEGGTGVTRGEWERKMERTRALTIELSDRLIKAEENIRRYSALVQQLLRKDKSLTITTTSHNTDGSLEETTQQLEKEAAPADAISADRIHTTPAAAELRPEAPSQPRATPPRTTEEPSTPTGDPPAGIKAEPPTSTRNSPQPPTTRTRRSIPRDSDVVVVLPATFNDNQHS